MQIERLFSGVPISRDGPGVYDRSSADSSGLEGSALVGRAQGRAFDDLERAQARLNDATANQGLVVQRLGGQFVQTGEQLSRIATNIAIREEDQRRTVEFHGRTAQYALDTDEALRLAATESAPDGRDLQKRFDERRKAAQERMFAGVNDPLLRDSLTVRQLDKDALSSIDARKLASGKLKQWSVDEYDKAEAARLKTVASSRLDDGVLINAIKEHEAHTNDMLTAGVFTAKEKNAADSRFRLAAGRRISMGEMSTDPGRYLRDLQNGRYNMLFDDAEVAQQSERAFNRVVQLQNLAATQAARAEARADRNLKRASDDLHKDAEEMVAKGLDITDFLATNKRNLSRESYSALTHLNARPVKAENDPETLVDLEKRVGVDDISADLNRAFRQNFINEATYTRLSGANRSALKDDQPQSPYKRGRELVRSTLDPTNLITGPAAQIAKVGMANALAEFDTFVDKNPDVRLDPVQMEGAARDIIKRYQIVTYERMSLSAELPRGYKGTRATLDGPAGLAALDQAEQKAVQQFDARRMTQSEYQAELQRIQDWRAILDVKGQTTAPAGNRPTARPGPANPAAPRK